MSRLKLEPLHQHHVDALVEYGVQPAQEWIVEKLRNPNWGPNMSRSGPAGAFLLDGRVIALAGLIDYPGTDRAVAWLICCDNLRPHFAALYKKMMRALRNFPRKRYEAYIDPNFPQARRLAGLAGFEREGLMRAFENGHDRELWARV